MQTRDYLKYIVEKIHSTVFATVDSEGRPVTCAIDIMDYDESGLYFLTAKGKNFYDRLKSNENIAFTAMKGEDTLSCVAVSVQGKAKEIGPDRLPDLFRKNPYMAKIYPAVKSADVVVLASPLYYWNMSGQLRTAVDRLFALEEGGENLLRGNGRSGALLMAAEGHGFEDVVTYYDHLMEHLRWNNLGHVLAGGNMAVGDIEGKQEIQEAFALGKSIL